MSIYYAATLTEKQVEVCQNLVTRCNQQDGTEVQYYFSNLFNHYKELPAFYLKEVAGEVVRVLALYADNPAVVEISGCVDPNHRKQGIFTELLRTALP